MKLFLVLLLVIFSTGCANNAIITHGSSSFELGSPTPPPEGCIEYRQRGGNC